MISTRQVWRALPRPNPIKCACCMVCECVSPILPTALWLLSLSNAWNVAAVAADLPKKSTCALEHGQPAQRTTSKVNFYGFSWVFDPSGSQSSPNGVPIVQLMFLYEAHARACLAGSAQLGPRFGRLSIKLERTSSSKPTKHPR